MKNKIILAISLVLISFLANAQQELKLVVESATQPKVNKYENISIIEVENGYVLTHPKNQNLYQIDYVEQKSCGYYTTSRDTTYFIFEKNKKYGVMDSFGNEVTPFKQNLKPQYDCSAKKWGFTKNDATGAKRQIDVIRFPSPPREEEIYNIMDEERKKYKYFHDFNNGTYWASNATKDEQKGGGLMSYKKKWIIPMSEDYWFVDFKNGSFLGLVPTRKLNRENSYAQSKVVRFGTGEVIFEDTLVGGEMKMYGNSLVFGKNKMNSLNSSEIVFKIFDLEKKKTLFESTNYISEIYGDFIILEKSYKYGLTSLTTLKSILPVQFDQVAFVNSNCILTTFSNDNKYKFGIYQVVKQNKK
jgi:hypothetical protein